MSSTDTTLPGLGPATSITVTPFTVLQRARMCSRAGWCVFPVSTHDGRKSGALKGWPQKATTDWDTIWDWFTYSHVGCDVGILTGPESGLWVLDIDVHKCDGYASARKLFSAHGASEVPDTFRVCTPSGGQQWYFRHPPDVEIRNSAGRLGRGLDVRGWHGMVVAPDAFGRQVINGTLPVADAPDWLLALVTKTAAERRPPPLAVPTVDLARKTAVRAAERLAHADAGFRNSALNREAYELGHLGAIGLLDKDEVKSLLLEACKVNGAWDDDGPRGLGQCVATFESGWRAGIRDGSAA